jgi:hypothetical protein
MIFTRVIGVLQGFSIEFQVYTLILLGGLRRRILIGRHV